MSLPLWSKHDARFYRALSVFPTELEGKYLGVEKFVGHFEDFYGRLVQDIVEALYTYSQSGRFNADIMLKTEYLESGKALDRITIALDQLRSKPEFDERHGLGEPVHTKVMGKLPLTLAEVRNLPDSARPYLEFKLSKIDRPKLHDDLVLYDNSFQPSRLVKSTQARELPPLNLADLKLTPESYNKLNGVLYLAPLHKRVIAGKSGVKRPSGTKYTQCWVMECLFKSDRTLLNGVEISTILGISKAVLSNNDNKKKIITNAVAEINNKVAEDSGPKKLIIIDGTKVKVDKSYL